MALKRNTRDNVVAYLFLFPFLLVFGFFLFYPIIFSFMLSFHKTTIYTDLFNTFSDMKYAGLDNYFRLFGDKEFWWSLMLTFYYAILMIPANIALSLLLALLLNNKLKGATFFRSAFFLPNVLDLLVIGVIWTLIYAPKYGLLSVLGEAINIKFLADGLMTDPLTALPAIALAMVLKGAGFGMILYLTSIQNIPTSVYEAADLDGAGWWSKLRHITWPMVKPITIFLVVTGILMSLNAFTEIFAMTTNTGGPNTSSDLFGGISLGATKISGFYLYKEFELGHYGYAAAISYVLLIVAVTVSLLNLKFLQSKEGV